jgi:hypothetical protein
MRKSFMFYLTWKSQVEILNDKELRRFINNLIQYHDGGGIELKSKTDKLVWNGVLPGLEINNEKYHSQVDRSRENGKKGGRPPREKKSQETQQVFEKPKKPDNSKEEILNREEIKDKSKQVNGNIELINVNRKEEIVGVGQTISSFLKSKIERLEDQLILEFHQYPFLVEMGNPSGIREIKHHVDPEELEKILPILKELAESKFKLRGNFD